MVLSEKFRVSDEELCSHISSIQEATLQEWEGEKSRKIEKSIDSAYEFLNCTTCGRSINKWTIFSNDSLKLCVCAEPKDADSPVPNSFASVMNKAGKTPFRLSGISRHMPIPKCNTKKKTIRIVICMKITADSFSLAVDPKIRLGPPPPEEEEEFPYPSTDPNSYLSNAFDDFQLPGANIPCLTSSEAKHYFGKMPLSNGMVPGWESFSFFSEERLSCELEENSRILEEKSADREKWQQNNLKSIIEHVTNIPTADQVLMCNKRVLTLNERSLELYNIYHGSVINLFIRTPAIKSRFLATSQRKWETSCGPDSIIQQSKSSRWPSMPMSYFRTFENNKYNLWLMPKWKMKRGQSVKDNQTEEFHTVHPEPSQFNAQANIFEYPSFSALRDPTDRIRSKWHILEKMFKSKRGAKAMVSKKWNPGAKTEKERWGVLPTVSE